MRAWTLGLVVLCSCGDEGAVRLSVELPVDPSLSPLGPDTPATLTLWAESDGEPPEVLTRDFDPAAPGAAFGELSIRDGVRLMLQVESPGGRLIGFGRAAEPVSVRADEDVTVPILLRRPFAYVAGAFRVYAMDTTLEPGEEYKGALDEPSFPVAVETTRDGAEVLVYAAGRLSMLSTSDHLPMGATVAIESVSDLAVSPDSRWAVALRVNSGVSIVDLDELRAGGTEPIAVPVAGASAVTVDATTAYVVSHGSPVCPSVDSSVVAVDLAGAEVGPMLALGAPASDIAIDHGSGTLAVAQPCRGMVVSLTSIDDASPLDLLAVPSPTTVAASRGRVWAMGSSGGGLVLASIRLDGTDMTSVALPTAEQSARTSDLSGPGQSAEVRMTADSIRALDMALLPDGERVALLSYAQFHADEVDGYIGFAPVIVFPTIDVTTHEYMLIDALSGGVVQRLRTSCTLTTSASDWGPELIDPASWECSDNPGQDVSTEPFSPTHVAVLYGDR